MITPLVFSFRFYLCTHLDWFSATCCLMSAVCQYFANQRNISPCRSLPQRWSHNRFGEAGLSCCHEVILTSRHQQTTRDFCSNSDQSMDPNIIVKYMFLKHFFLTSHYLRTFFFFFTKANKNIGSNMQKCKAFIWFEHRNVLVLCKSINSVVWFGDI